MVSVLLFVLPTLPWPLLRLTPWLPPFPLPLPPLFLQTKHFNAPTSSPYRKRARHQNTDGETNQPERRQQSNFGVCFSEPQLYSATVFPKARHPLGTEWSPTAIAIDT